MLYSRSQLKNLILPICVEQLLSVAMGCVDTFMVAAVGESAISGISLADNVTQLFFLVFSALATGGSIIAAQYLGNDDTKNARTAAYQLMTLCLLIAFVISIPLIVLRKSAFRFLFATADASVLDAAQRYFFYTGFSYPFLALSYSGSALSRVYSNAKLPMMVTFVSNLINIVGNALSVYVFEWGVDGVAISTLVSRVAAAVYLMLYLCKKRGLLPIYRFSDFVPRKSFCKKILRIGLPTGIENGMFQIGKISLLSLVSKFGTAAIAANAVVGSLTVIGIIPGNAINMALTVIVGRCMGAHCVNQAEYYTKKLTVLTYVTVGILNCSMMLLAHPILHLYHLSENSFSLAVCFLIYNSICTILLWPAAFTVPYCLRASGDNAYTLKVALLSMLLGRIAVSYILAFATPLGAFSVWVAMSIDWLIRTIFFCHRFHRGAWKEKTVL